MSVDPPFLRLLGPVELTLGQGNPVSLNGLRPRAVLGLLVLQHPRPVAMSTIVDSVWGDDPPETVRNAIQVAVSNLRQILRPLGADIVRTGDSYAWNAGDVRVDLPQFEQQVAEGRAALRGANVARGLELLQHAVELWQGPPFEGTDAPYVETARAGLERTYRLAQTDRAEALLKLGRPAESLQIAAVMQGDAPYDERLLTLMVTAQYALGRTAEAIELWTTFQRRLADELGLDPTPQARQLFDQLLNHRLEIPAFPAPVVELEAAPAPEARVIASPELVVGRDEFIEHVVARLGVGERHLTLVGLGGIGKTTVALAMAHRLSKAGAAVTFSELETATDAGAALLRICRDLDLDTSDDLELALSSATPDQCAVLVLDNAEQVDGLGDMLERVLTHSKSLAVVVTSRRPLGNGREVVVPVPSLTVRGGDGGWGPAAELFWIRAQEVRPTLDRAAHHDDVLALCELLNGLPLAIQLVARLSRVLTPRQLYERTRQDSQLLLDTTGPAVPARQRTLRAVLEATIDTLSPSTTRVLQMQAMVDGWISLELLDTVVGEPAGFVPAIDALSTAGLLELDNDGRARNPVPVRDHLRAQPKGATLVDQFVASVSQLVQSHERALTGPEAGAVVSSLARDDDALTSALRRAAEHRWGDAAARIALSMNRYWLLSGRLSEGYRWLSEIRSLGVGHPETALRLELLTATFASYLSTGDVRGQLALSLARADACDLSPDRILVNAWCCLASQHATKQAADAAQACAERAAELAARSGDQTLVALARDLAGHVAALIGDHEGSLRAMVTGIADARNSGDDWDLANLLLASADSLIALNRPDDAALMLDEAFDIVEAGPLLIQVLIYRGVALTMQGNLAAAAGHLLEAARQIQSRFPNPLFLADALHALGTVASLSGHSELALRRWAAADAMINDLGADPGHRQPGATLAERRRIAEVVPAPRAELLSALGAADPARTLAEAIA